MGTAFNDVRINATQLSYIALDVGLIFEIFIAFSRKRQNIILGVHIFNPQNPIYKH